MSGYPAYVRLKDGSKVLVQSEEEEKAVKAAKSEKPEAKSEKPEPAVETEPEDDPPSKFLGTKKK